MKRVLAFVILCCMLMTACSNGSSERIDEFCDKAQGIWVNLDSCKEMGPDSISFSFVEFKDGGMTFGDYPGCYGATGTIVKVKETEENEYDVTFHYEETEGPVSHEEGEEERQFSFFYAAYRTLTIDGKTKYHYMGIELGKAHEFTNKKYRETHVETVTKPQSGENVNTALPSLNTFESELNKGIASFYKGLNMDAASKGYLVKNYEAVNVEDAEYEKLIGGSYGPGSNAALIATATGNQITYCFSYFSLVGVDVNDSTLITVGLTVMVPAMVFNRDLTDFDSLYAFLEEIMAGQTGETEEERVITKDGIKYTLAVKEHMIGLTIDASNLVSKTVVATGTPKIEVEAPKAEEKFSPGALREGDPFEVSGTVFYSDYPCDLGSEYCFIENLNPYAYIFEGVCGEVVESEETVLFVRNNTNYPEDLPLMKQYIGQEVTISGKFVSDCHGVPLLTDITVLESSGEPFNTGYPAYNEVLKEYKTALLMSDTRFNQKYDDGLDCSSINAWSAREEPLSYTLYDVDKNGTPELFVGSGEYYNIIDFYLLNGDRTVKPFENIGYRSGLSVLTDGSLVFSGSNGMASGSTTIYSISADGSGLELMTNYYFDEDRGRDATEMPEDVYLPYEEYNEIVRNLERVDMGRVTWSPIN